MLWLNSIDWKLQSCELTKSRPKMFERQLCFLHGLRQIIHCQSRSRQLSQHTMVQCMHSLKKIGWLHFCGPAAATVTGPSLRCRAARASPG
jgi:hypothetical protein